MGRLKSPSKTPKTRLDQVLLTRGFAASPQDAIALIMAGKVRVDGQPAAKPGAMVAADAKVEVFLACHKYASRAGFKLEGALADFGVNVDRCVCLDVGASSGGFTDCLLQHGARRVYAVDVNTAQLDWKLQRDPRVTAVKKNARFLRPDDIPETVDLVTADVSFISVRKIIPAAAPLAKIGADFLILIKPQFELPKRLVGKGGIVRDGALQERAILSVRAAAERASLEILGVKPSHLAGAEGNREFFLHARRAV
jgi:23S rRNA (cytidine1920-2'-O)/16S rRNA (cytidine1409-2'-O)-methyltransferase